MKKILIIATTPLMHDGLTKVLLETIDRADRSRAELFLVPGMGFTHDFEEKIKERQIPYFPVPNRAYDPLAYYPALIRVLGREHFDVLHIHGNSATMAFDLLLAALFGIPVRISHIHNTATNHPALHAAVKPFLNLLVTDPAACSDPAGEWLYNKKFTVVKNGIDPDKFAFNAEVRERTRREMGLTDRFVVGHVGRMRRQKNHAFLLEIFAAILKRRQDAVLLLVGEGELFDEVKEKVEKMGLSGNVIFCGTTDRMAELYMAMDVFLLPSLYEGLGIAAVEAQAAGLPAVLSDEVPGEAVFAENTERIPLSESPEVWAEAVLKYEGAERTDRRGDVRRAGYDAAEIGETLNKLWHLPEKAPSGLKISVVMAVYNGKKYLKEQLDSIREQTCPPDEVIISDDCSRDGSAELISSYIKEHGLAGWRLIHHDAPSGAGANFAFAMREASGDLIFLADQDDVWLPDKIGRMAAAFADQSVYLAVSSIRYMDAAGNEKRTKTQLSCRKDHEVALSESLAVCSYLGMSMAMRREVLLRADSTLWEKSSHDWALLIAAHDLGKVVFLGKPGQFYRQHDGNASAIRGGSRLMNRLSLVRRQRQHVRCAAEHFAGGSGEMRAAKAAERFLAARERALEEQHTVGLVRMFFLYGRYGYPLRTFAADVFVSLSCKKSRDVV